MDAVAKFVFGSGGTVTIPELNGFFTENPRVEEAFYAAASPVRQLKKILRHLGPPHGLSWGDTGSIITHKLTETQHETFPLTVEQWIPRCLDALETLLRGVPNTRLKAGEFARLIVALPVEMAFMRRRSGGNVIKFVQMYDPEAKRFGASDTELWLGDIPAPSSSLESLPILVPVPVQQCPEVQVEKTEAEEPTGQVALKACKPSPIGPKAVQDTRPRVLSWDECTFVLPQSVRTSLLVPLATPRATTLVAVASTAEVSTPLPLNLDAALQALHAVCRVFAAHRVFRSPCSISSRVLLTNVCRLVIQRLCPAKPQTENGAEYQNDVLENTTESSSPPSGSPSSELEPEPVHVVRLLVPTASCGLEWRIVAYE